MPPEKDRFSQLKAKFSFTREVAKEMGTREVFVPTYQWNSYFRYWGALSEQLPLTKGSHFTLLSSKKISCGGELFLFAEKGANYSELGCFPHRTVVSTKDFDVRGKRLGTFELTHYHQ